MLLNRYFFYILTVICIKAGAQSSALVVGDSLMAQGQYLQAIKSYEKLPISQANLPLAKAYRAMGNTAKALVFYGNAYEINPENTALGFAYGSLLRATGRMPLAEVVFEELIQRDSTNASAYYQLGMVRLAAQDSTAIPLLARALELNDQHMNARYQLSKELLEKRQYETVDTLLTVGLKQSPNNTKLLQLQGIKQYVTKRYHDAIASFELLDSIATISVQQREYLANSYSRTYQYEPALEQFKILINQYDDQNSNWHFTLSTVYLGLNEPEKARRHINIAIGLLDKPLDNHFLTLAITYNREGNYRAVMEALQQALAENAQNELAKYQLAVAADNRYDDKSLVLPFYEAYAKQFPEGRHIDTVTYRISDLKELIFMDKD
ncbi:tetratricopeptide repeat protein [Gilvibacter sediminis]|uniref:tetratricopeptide repeat protein n=1 Tax=Gilvibacter sediminis TaxID=379071 RepID=UPI00234FF7B1|nr:tetratricopeptide repeat protein [Gilvibacter sediminis]MDC7997267.1 hypothetical protein [Gilvibacter sediminis]